MADVLDDARSGTLPTSWRADLRGYALTLPSVKSLADGGEDDHATPKDDSTSLSRHLARECLLNSPRVGHDVSCIRSESQRIGLLFACAILDITRIEPAPWEPYAAQGDWRLALHHWYADRIAVLQRTRSVPGAEAHRADGEDAVMAAQERDVIEAKFRAGLSAGTGVADDWRWRFVEQIDVWQPTALRTAYRRRMKLEDNFSDWENLPQTWTARCD